MICAEAIDTRVCSGCGKSKPLSEFPRNRSKKKGREYRCLLCEADRKREERRRARLPNDGERHDYRPMMSDELFAVYYRNTDLRSRLREEAAVLARNSREKEEYIRDLVQVAWMHIGMCVADQSIDHYAAVGIRAMGRDQWKRRYRREFGLDSLECMTRSEFDMWNRGHY